MYNPTIFREEKLDTLHRLMHEHPLGTLITHSSTGISANHIPFILHQDKSGNSVLRGHVARSNPLWKTTRPDSEALIIFQGPQSYITPSWYPSKKEHGKVVPTWNYSVVHAHGTLQAIEDPNWLQAHLESLTTSQEKAQPSPWTINDAPVEYIHKMIKGIVGIVGIEIGIARLEGKLKLGQNKNSADRRGVIAGLNSLDRTEESKLAEMTKP
ncbi:MAG: FMN-binding negative transcriptional regulator [Granulosicoccus sp.]